MAQYGGGLDEWLDLSTGINPHAWPLPEIAAAAWRRLPSVGDGRALLGAARDAYGVAPGVGIVAAPGTQALIQWLPRLAPPGAVAIVGPTYAEHAIGWRLAGRDVIDVTEPVLPEGVRHAVLVRPNNPDGRTVDCAALASSVAARGGWLVIDESFADVQPGPSAGSGTVVLRSFGKFYGLAGVRLGFAIADPAITEAIGAALGPWAVSGPALQIGRLALADRGWAAAMRVRLAAEAARLDGVLAGAGCVAVGGTALYRLVRHPGAALMHRRLAARRIWVRRFDHAPDLLRFGLPGAGLERLAAALS